MKNVGEVWANSLIIELSQRQTIFIHKTKLAATLTLTMINILKTKIQIISFRVFKKTHKISNFKLCLHTGKISQWLNILLVRDCQSFEADMEKKKKYRAIFCCYVSVNSSKSIGKGSEEPSLLLLLNPNALMERSR